MTADDELMSVESNGHVTVRQLRGGVASTVLMGDGACVTVMLRDGTMEWSLEFEGREWRQRVVYRERDERAERVVDDVPSNGPSMVVHRPAGRLRRKMPPTTIDSITGAQG